MAKQEDGIKVRRGADGFPAIVNAVVDPRTGVFISSTAVNLPGADIVRRQMAAEFEVVAADFRPLIEGDEWGKVEIYGRWDDLSPFTEVEYCFNGVDDLGQREVIKVRLARTTYVFERGERAAVIAKTLRGDIVDEEKMGEVWDETMGVINGAKTVRVELHDKHYELGWPLDPEDLVARENEIMVDKTVVDSERKEVEKLSDAELVAELSAGMAALELVDERRPYSELGGIEVADALFNNPVELIVRYYPKIDSVWDARLQLFVKGCFSGIQIECKNGELEFREADFRDGSWDYIRERSKREAVKAAVKRLRGIGL